MNFEELINETASFVGRDPADAMVFISAAFAVMRRDVVDGGEVVIPGFGTFGVRMSVDEPDSWAKVAYPGSMEPHFSADEDFKKLTREAGRR